jgi:uncharacterized delta-60 repeat protein
MVDLPAHARVVIVGGGIVGCSVAYHLAKRGCTDVVLLERKQLTSGTTWHAAGLVGQLRATHNLTRLAKYTTDLFATLEAETEQATGFVQRGSVAVATNNERFEELKRSASMARLFGLEVEIVTPADIQAMVPLAFVDDLVGGVLLPNDGQTNPIDTTQALAKSARSRGVKIAENVKVNRIVVENGRAVGVSTDAGDVRADAVVNCAGMWARDLADGVDAVVPLHAAEHFYIVTEHIPALSPTMPVLRDPDGCGYFKEDAGKLLVGWFEPVAKPWGMKSIPESFAFDSLPEDFEHIEPLMAAAAHRMPVLAETGIRLFFNGPESFTPDDRYLLGESPDVPGMFVAAGFNSIGIQSAGGAGKVLADWIVDGRPPMDLWDVDVRRMMPFQRNRSYLHDRTVEALGLLYAMHWPYRQPETARGVRRSPEWQRLVVSRRSLPANRTTGSHVRGGCDPHRLPDRRWERLGARPGDTAWRPHRPGRCCYSVARWAGGLRAVTVSTNRCYNDILVERLNADGTPDSSFGPAGDGRAFLRLGGRVGHGAFGVAVDPLGRLVVGSHVGVLEATHATSKLAAARLLPDGRIDVSFGGGGACSSASVAETSSRRVVPRSILPAGCCSQACLNRTTRVTFSFLAVRLLDDGQPDPAFGTSGVAVTDFTVGAEMAMRLVQQPTGRIVLVGWGQSVIVLAGFVP